MATKVSAGKIRKIERLAREGHSLRQIAKVVGLHNTTVMRYMPEDAKHRAQTPGPKATRVDDVQKNKWTISLTNTRVHTEEQLLKQCEVDANVWEVERFKCVAHEIGMKPPATTEYVTNKDGKRIPMWVRFSATPVVETLYSVTAWLKKKVDVQAVREEIERFKTEALKYSPKFPHIVRMRSKYSTGVWVEPSLYDHHFGALIWAKETGHDDYDSAIARRCWGEALSCLMDRTAPYKPEGAVFPIGNDAINANNRKGSTERDTPQSMDTRYEKVYGVTREAVKWGIDQLLARGLKVHVPIVRGNHDPTVIWHLGEELTAWYHKNPRVTIDNRPTMRKWWEHGVNMLMFTHGNAGKLEDYGKTMASEQPEMWGRTKWREAHTGDKHQKRQIEQPGCLVRILSSLRPPCAWSAEQMYQSIRAAENFVWSKTEGLIGEAHYSILPGQLARIKQ